MIKKKSKVLIHKLLPLRSLIKMLKMPRRLLLTRSMEPLRKLRKKLRLRRTAKKLKLSHSRLRLKTRKMLIQRIPSLLLPKLLLLPKKRP